MVKITPLSDVTAGYASATASNTNNTRIEQAFDNTLSRDGSSPNQMEADIDLNSNDLLNVSRLYTDDLFIDGTQITSVSTLGAIVTQTEDGFMSSEDKVRLDNLTVDAFNTRQDAIDAAIDVPALYIRGYTSAGDQGDGLYKAAASEPFHEGKFQSGSNWYELVPTNGWVTDKQFGVVGDDTTDDTAALQNAINYCLSNSAAGTAGQASLRLLSKDIRVTDTIFVTYGDGLQGITIEGFARPYRSESGMNGCTIRSEVTDRMAIAIDGGRHVKLSNFRVEGRGFADLAIDDQQNSFIDETTWDTALTDAGFTTPGERYAPRAGICIDGYVGTRPSGGAGSGTEPYPVPTLPSHIGAGTSGYGRNSSSRTIIENVGVAGFEVGVVIGPSVDGTQGDYTTLENMLLERNKYHVSIGQSQSRGVKIDKMLWSRAFTVLANNVHGAQQGRFAAHMNLEGGTCVNFLSFGASSALGPIEITGEAEEVHRIGDVATGTSTENGWQFNRFKFNFRHEATGQYPANVLDCNSTNARILFKTCIFTGFNKVISFKDCPNVVMADACRFIVEAPSTAITSTGRMERTFHNGRAGFVGELDSNGYRHHEIISLPYEITAGTVSTSQQTFGEQYSKVTREWLIPLWCREFSHPVSIGNIDPLERRPLYSTNISNATAFAGGSFSAANRTISGTDPSPDQLEDMQFGGQPGDVFKCINTGTVVRVDSKDYGTGVTSHSLMTNYQVVEAGPRRSSWAAGISYSIGDIVRDADLEFFQCSVAGISAGDSTDLAGGSDTGVTWVACTYEIIDNNFDITTSSCDRASLALYTTSTPLFLTSTASSNLLTAPKTSNTNSATAVMGEIIVNDAIKHRGVRKAPTHVVSESQIDVVTAGTSLQLSGNARVAWTDYEQTFFIRFFT